MYSRKELEVIDGHLRRRDTELMVQLTHCRSTHALYGSIKADTGLTGYSERVRAACVCPHVRKCNLLGRALL
jgi:hypothetical protein